VLRNENTSPRRLRKHSPHLPNNQSASSLTNHPQATIPHGTSRDCKKTKINATKQRSYASFMAAIHAGNSIHHSTIWKLVYNLRLHALNLALHFIARKKSTAISPELCLRTDSPFDGFTSCTHTSQRTTGDSNTSSQLAGAPRCKTTFGLADDDAAPQRLLSSLVDDDDPFSTSAAGLLLRLVQCENYLFRATKSHA
jgi:hypothetical protein